jgi:hypothetical protein
MIKSPARSDGNNHAVYLIDSQIRLLANAVLGSVRQTSHLVTKTSPVEALQLATTWRTLRPEQAMFCFCLGWNLSQPLITGPPTWAMKNTESSSVSASCTSPAPAVMQSPADTTNSPERILPDSIMISSRPSWSNPGRFSARSCNHTLSQCRTRAY